MSWRNWWWNGWEQWHSEGDDLVQDSGTCDVEVLMDALQSGESVCNIGKTISGKAKLGKDIGGTDVDHNCCTNYEENQTEEFEGSSKKHRGYE